MDAHANGPPLPGRWNPEWIDRRRQREADRHSLVRKARVSGGMHLPFHYKALRLALKAARLYARGYRNYTDIRITEVTHAVEGWPPPLDGFRILQLSDLHIDLDPVLLPAICRQLRGLDCELAVITGDFLESARTDTTAALADLKQLLAAIGTPPFGRFGVLGNHDSFDLAVELEAMGLPILVNEARLLGSGTATFGLAGVDDAYFFKTHDLATARHHGPEGLPMYFSATVRSWPLPPPRPVSRSCSAAIPTVVRSAFREVIPFSPWKKSRYPFSAAPGATDRSPVLPPPAREPATCRSVLIVRPKLLFIHFARLAG